MAPDPSPRKLAVILHADVVGSTALVQKSESLAHARIREAFRRFSSTIEAYGGTTHELRGDALVAEFARASDAIAAALAFQRENEESNARLEDDLQPRLRIGISLGEVVVADDTVTGAGVVVAQRVEQMAEPGGVCITAAVREAAPQYLPLDYSDLGKREAKGFAEPVHVYRARVRDGERLPAPEAAGPGKGPSGMPKRTWIPAVSLIAVIVVAGVVWWRPWLSAPAPVSVEQTTFPLPDRPSIAVLPFDNLSGDEDQEYFADGITNDIINDLSKLSNLFVIASNSVFTYKGTPVKVQQVGRELGVRYVLEGSIQRAGGRVRINAQLVDAATGHHLWGERYNRELEDIFALQDEITEKIVSALAVTLTDEERIRLAHRYTDSVEGYDYFLRGQSLYVRQTKEDNGRAREMFEQAIALDPTFARAYAALAMTHVDDATRQWSPDPAQSVERALEFALKAVSLDDSLPQAQWALGYVYLWGKKSHEEALEAAGKAIALDPNNADGYTVLATTNNFAGRPEEAIRLVHQAMRLSRHSTYRHFSVLGRSYYELARYEEAVAALQKALDQNPSFLPSQLLLAASYARLGQKEEARWVVDEVLTRDPDFSVETWIERHPGNRAQGDRFMADLREAGFN